MQDYETEEVAPALRRGRASLTNRAGRFEAADRVRVDDGWDLEDEAQAPLRTEFITDRTKSILARNASPDVSFDRSINAYRGCEHGCIYCFARPTHAYLGMSPGLDFETRVMIKPRAAELLRRTLRRPGYEVATIAMGTNTDPYQPGEQRFALTRQVLEVLRDFRHPVSIVTKGGLIRRDIDILGPMAGQGLAAAGVSLTTLDAGLSRAMEPRAAAPKVRLKVIRALVEAGVPVRAMIAPVIPGLTDHELEGLLEAAAEAGASHASYILLRLPREVSGLFREWLAEHRPDRAARVMARVRDVHGGQEYDAQWGRRMRGQGLLARLIGRRFEVATRRLGLSVDGPDLRTDLFKVPGRAEQLSLS